MPRKQVGAIDSELLGAVDDRAAFLGQTRRVFIERALRERLGSPDVVIDPERSTPGFVQPSSSVHVRERSPVKPPVSTARRSPVSRQHSPTCQCAMCK